MGSQTCNLSEGSKTIMSTMLTSPCSTVNWNGFLKARFFSSKMSDRTVYFDNNLALLVLMTGWLWSDLSWTQGFCPNSYVIPNNLFSLSVKLYMHSTSLKRCWCLNLTLWLLGYLPDLPDSSWYSASAWNFLHLWLTFCCCEWSHVDLHIKILHHLLHHLDTLDLYIRSRS